MKKNYVAPCAKVTNVKFEGMIAASYNPSGDNPGGELPSVPGSEEAKEDADFDW